jgi:two-component system, sensor histidine kinase
VESLEVRRRAAGPVDAAQSARADRVRALFEQTPAVLAGNAVGIALVGLAFWPVAPLPRIGAWLALAAALWSARLLHWLRYRARREADAATLMVWRGSWRALVLIQGAMWPLAVWWFWGLGATFHGLALILIAVAYSFASVQLLAPQAALFNAFSSLVLLPVIVRVASDTSQPWHWQLASVLALLFGVMLLMGRTYRDALSQAIALKQHTEHLAAQLRREKSAADEARSAAEAANRSKTQFFAAASHDLRQPLHALGLFTLALRQRMSKTADPELGSLLDSIDQSLAALEGLFGELLDITRIDSGGVEVRPGPLRLQDLFARLRLHFEPVAFDKGLALSFRGGHRVAFSDGVLVERILRNLVSNAIRYTEDGGVLVACRERAGRLALQVWDSGVGIDEASLPRVFDEFYQVRAATPLATDPSQGVGLGLAIVKRLAGLLDAPLSVRSMPGHGTVFTLELPLAEPAGRPA